MGAKHPQIEGAPALVFFAARADFQRSAEGSLSQKCRSFEEGWVVTISVGHGDSGAARFGKLADFVGFARGADIRFFDVDSAYSRLDGVFEHLMVLVCVTRADGDDVRTRFLQKRAVVGVRLGCGEPFLCGSEACGVGVRDGDDVGSGFMEPEGVEAMTVVAASGVSDDADAEGCSLREELSDEWGGGEGGEEGATEHGMGGSTTGARLWGATRYSRLRANREHNRCEAVVQGGWREETRSQ